MKPRLAKRIAAILLMVTMLFGEALTVLADTYTVVTTGAGEQVTFTYQYWCGDPATLNDNNEDNDPYKLYRDLKVTYDYSVQEGDEVLIDANADGLEDMPYDLTDICVGTLQSGEKADAVVCENVGTTEDGKVSAEIVRDKDKVIRLYYNPVVQEDYTNDVTMFDYDVMHNIKCAEGTNSSNATMFKKIVVEGGSTYSNTNSRYYYYLSWDGEELYIRQKNNSDTKIKVTYSTFTLTKDDGTVIRQVQKGDGKELVTMDAGINKNYYTTSTGTNHHTYYLAMGDYGRVHEVSLNINKSGVGTLDANNNNAWLGSGEYYGEDDGDRAIVPGLVSRLNGANNYYASLVMAQMGILSSSRIVEPGYFSKTHTEGKTVYADRFVANFKQVGNTYTLYSVKDGKTGSERFAINVPEGTTDYSLENIYKNNGQYNGIRSDFFPLDINGLGERNVDQATDKNNPNNCYFGMRYDFNFTIGDYIGPLEYTFAGDDDLWVFLDGKLVLDLGGMHSAYPTAAGYNDGDERDEDKNMVTSPTDPYSVNLWNEIITGSNKNPETANFDREKEHQITVLYMERGGFDSACYMNFTLPNAKGMGYVGQVPANIELVKVDGTDTSKVLSGAEFKLTKYKDAEKTTVDNYFGTNGSVTTTTGEDGKIKFSGITAGTYKLEETKAPDGYCLSTDAWTVIATADGNDIVSVTVKDKNGNNVTKIKNVPFEYTGDSAKKATLVDWENRIYKLDLSAIAQAKSISTTKDANVLLLVDVSGSMIYTDALIPADQLDTGNIYFTSKINDYGDGWYVSSAVANRLMSTAKSDGQYYGIPSTGTYVFYDTSTNAWYEKAISNLGYTSSGLFGSQTGGKSNSLSISGATKVDPTTMSLYTNRSEMFVNAAEAFVNGLSADSKVAVVTFGNNNGASQKIGFTSLSSGKANVIAAIESAVGVHGTATYPGSGFVKASQMYTNLNDFEDSYLVFFTDGDGDDKDTAKTNASSLRNKGVVIYSIGVGEGATDKTFLQDVAGSANNVKVCDNMADVANALTSLGISAPGIVGGVKIVDEISPYFELCDQDGTPITELAGATVAVKDDGTTVITWENQDVALGADGLTKTIYIKAKDSFAGGNYVPTNGNYIVTFPDGTKSEEDTPHVNVKTTIEVGDEEDTIFLGEDLTMCFTTEDQTTVSGVRYDKNGNIVAVVCKDGDSYKEYTNLEFVNVTVKWTDENGNEVTVEDILKSTPEETTHYNATITVAPKYAADSEEAKAAAESMKNSDVLYTVETLTATGTYTVNVISGSLVINKTIDLSDVNFLQGDPIFTFKVMKDGEFYSYHTVRYTKDSKDGTVTVAELTDLPKGVYTVEELDTLRYELNELTDESVSGSADKKVSPTIATFGIGVDIDSGERNMSNLDGVANFTNERTQDKYYSDTDVVVNNFTIGEDGTIKWTDDSLEQ